MNEEGLVLEYVRVCSVKMDVFNCSDGCIKKKSLKNKKLGSNSLTPFYK